MIDAYAGNFGSEDLSQAVRSHRDTARNRARGRQPIRNAFMRWQRLKEGRSPSPLGDGFLDKASTISDSDACAPNGILPNLRRNLRGECGQFVADGVDPSMRWDCRGVPVAKKLASRPSPIASAGKEESGSVEVGPNLG